MAFHQVAAPAVDYLPCRYGRSRLLFRGPRRDLTAPYVAFLGGSETYGKFVSAPFADLCEAATGRLSVNLGCVQAGPDVWLKDQPSLDIAARASIAVIQIPGALNLTNRLYSVHPRRNDRFLRAAPLLQTLFRDVDFTEFAFTRHMLGTLAARSPEKFELVVDELRAAWRARMELLLSRLPCPKVLLWIGTDTPQTAPRAPRLEGEPALVDRGMVDAIRAFATDYVEVRLPPEPAPVPVAGTTFAPADEAAAHGLPGAAAHRAVADALVPVLRGLP